MNKKLICIIVAIMLVCCLVCVLAACGEKENNNATDPTDNGQTSQQGGENQGEQGSQGGSTEVDMVAQYHISFYTGDKATQVERMDGILAGASVTPPAAPQLAYNEFEGWYTDYDPATNTYQNPFDFSAMPAHNVCLYAKWNATVSNDELSKVESELAAVSEEAHLYIHYRRFDNVPDSYEPLNLWVWPYGFAGRTFDWDRDSAGKVIVSTVGATCCVDLTTVYTDAGKEENQVMQFLKNAGAYTAGSIHNADNYMDARFGFLIVYKASKGIKGEHWRSDGNADQLFTVSDAVWDNGSLHIFCVQDNVKYYTFHLTDDQSEITNPYENDDGTHVSYANVKSSETIKVTHGTKLLDTASGVGYQVMVSSFADSDGDGIGDIRGIIENIGYLESLHVDTLWLTPIQLSDSYHGYDIIDYKEVDPKFGSLDDYKELLRLCHQKSIKVIMDLVLNHTSTNNVWFQKSAKMVVEDGIDYRSFYQWRNHTKETLSKDWYPYSEYNYSYYGKFSPSMPELNYDYDGTRAAILDVALYWLGILGDGTGVDGFRIDAVKHIYMADEVTQSPGDVIIRDFDDATNTDYSSNLTKNLNFFCWFVNAIKSQYANAYLVGENFDGHAFNVAPYYEAYDGMLDFYMYYNFGQLSQYPTAAAALAGANASVERTNSQPKGDNTESLLYGAWSYAGVLDTQQRYSELSTGDRNVMGGLFTSNHDIPRLVNNMVRDYSGASWVAGTVNDGNKDKAITLAKAQISAMMTMPGISFIYYGDELGMSSNYLDGQDATSPHVDRQYRQPFKWTTKDWDKGGSEYITHYSISGDETYYVTWDTYNIQLKGVDEQTGDANSLLEVTRYWTDKKSSDDVLRYGDYTFEHAWGPQAAQLLSYKRSYNGVTYWCLTNFGAEGNVHGSADISSMVAKGDVIYATPNAYNNGQLAGGGTVVIRLR